MKRLISITVLVILATGLALGQDDDSTYSYRPKRVRAKVGGAGGFTPGWGLFKFDEINKVLKSSNMPELSGDPMYLAGGEGYGYIMFLKNIRLGGRGVSGTVSASSVDLTTGVKKNVDYRVSYGGFLIDYAVPIAEKLDVALGVTLGGGSVDITMTRDNGKFIQWGGLWNEFGRNDSTINVTRHLNGSFFTFQPSVSVEYAILQWFQIRMGVTYPYMSNATWKLENDNEILGVPAKLKTDGPVITAGIMFGFFN